MDWKEMNAQMREATRRLNRAAPEAVKGFTVLSKAVKENGVLEFKVKELIAIAIAVADGCEPCIGFHVDALVRAGGNREELADALSMAIQMGGGPALMYAAKAMEAFDQFAEAAAPA